MSAPPIPIAPLAGPVLLGYIFNWGLYGCLAVQVLMYYLAFPKDKAAIKCLVYALFAIETTQSILVMHDAFHTYAVEYGSLSALNDVQLNWLSVPMMSGIISCTVQIFFAYRIYTLSQSKAVASFICMIALMQGSAAIAAGVQALQVGDFLDLQVKAHVSTSVWLVGSASCDIIIALVMTYYLSSRNTGFRKTRILIAKLIRLTVETGTITATFATVDVILFLAFPNSNYHTVPALTLAKLYSNTALAILNSRMLISGGREDMSAGSNSAITTWPNASTTQTKRVVHIQQDVFTDSLPMGRIDSSTKVQLESDPGSMRKMNDDMV